MGSVLDYLLCLSKSMCMCHAALLPGASVTSCEALCIRYSK